MTNVVCGVCKCEVDGIPGIAWSLCETHLEIVMVRAREELTARQVIERDPRATICLFCDKAAPRAFAFMGVNLHRSCIIKVASYGIQ